MTPFAGQYRAQSARNNHELLHSAPSVVWKSFADGYSLRAFIFAPPCHSLQQRRPAVLFFCGGMWSRDCADDFAAWALHLAHRGIVCIIPEYRNYGHFDVAADEIILEGIDAWHWLHDNAYGLGIDPRRITLAGEDAGGLMALNAGMQPIIRKRKFWQFGKRDILPLSPCALAIFRGIVDPEAPEARALCVHLDSSSPERVNPCELLRRNLPPLFCVHGMRDPLLDYEQREWFCKEWQRRGNDAQFLLCPHGDHSITRFEVNPAVFEYILLAWEEFMISRSLWPEEVMEEATLN